MKNKDLTDVIAGVLLIVVGLFAFFYADRYQFGTLNRMGPGFFPVVLGGLLAFLGVLIALPALFRAGHGPKVEWMSILLVLGSVVVFALLLRPAGVILATMASVFMASWAERDWTLVGRVLLSVAIAFVTWLVFIAGLGMLLPVWPWS